MRFFRGERKKRLEKGGRDDQFSAGLSMLYLTAAPYFGPLGLASAAGLVFGPCAAHTWLCAPESGPGALHHPHMPGSDPVSSPCVGVRALQRPPCVHDPAHKAILPGPWGWKCIGHGPWGLSILPLS